MPEMEYGWIIPLLFMITLLAVAIFALISKGQVEARRHDPNAPKSTLAKDGPQGGVEFLKPLDQQRHTKPAATPVLE
jgi:hypothetical protein